MLPLESYVLELFAQASPVTQPAVYVPVIVVLMAAVGWAVRLNCSIASVKTKLEAERRETRKLIENNTRAMRELVHYVKWSIEHVTGQIPPPPVPDLEPIPGG